MQRSGSIIVATFSEIAAGLPRASGALGFAAVAAAAAAAAADVANRMDGIKKQTHPLATLGGKLKIIAAPKSGHSEPLGPRLAALKRQE